MYSIYNIVLVSDASIGFYLWRCQIFSDTDHTPILKPSGAAHTVHNMEDNFIII